ncbi:unnamed protein product [Natator depressus]
MKAETLQYPKEDTPALNTDNKLVEGGDAEDAEPMESQELFKTWLNPPQLLQKEPLKRGWGLKLKVQIQNKLPALMLRASEEEEMSFMGNIFGSYATYIFISASLINLATAGWLAGY